MLDAISLSSHSRSWDSLNEIILTFSTNVLRKTFSFNIYPVGKNKGGNKDQRGENFKKNKTFFSFNNLVSVILYRSLDCYYLVIIVAVIYIHIIEETIIFQNSALLQMFLPF